jgi:hypothetical protein
MCESSSCFAVTSLDILRLTENCRIFEIIRQSRMTVLVEFCYTADIHTVSDGWGSFCGGDMCRSILENCRSTVIETFQQFGTSHVMHLQMASRTFECKQWDFRAVS